MTARRLIGGRADRRPLHVQPLSVRPPRAGGEDEPGGDRDPGAGRDLPAPAMVTRMGRPGEPYDLALAAGSPITSTRRLPQLPARSGGSGHSAVRRPRVQAQVGGGRRLTGPQRYLAYGELDADVARNDAPWPRSPPGLARLLLCPRGLPGLHPCLRDGPRRPLHQEEDLEDANASDAIASPRGNRTRLSTSAPSSDRAAGARATPPLEAHARHARTGADARRLPSPLANSLVLSRVFGLI